MHLLGNPIELFRTLSPRYIGAMGAWLAAGVVVLILLLKLRRRVRGRPLPLRLVHLGLSMWMLAALLTACELGFSLLVDTSDSINLTRVSLRWYEIHVDPYLHQLTFPDGTSYTYRDERLPDVIPAGRQHLCFLGDSFTFGHGVANAEDRFSDRIRRMLSEEHPNRFIVSNLSYPGTGLERAESILEHFSEYGPQVDTVVYTLCLNDIESFDEQAGAFSQQIQRTSPNFVLFERSYFLNFVYFRLVQFSQPGVQDYSSHVREYYDGAAWPLMVQELQDMQSLCSSQGAELHVAVFPFLHALGPEYPFEPVHAKIVAACHDAGVPVLDLEPVLTPHASEGLTVSSIDAHPNERAHELAANAIRRQLLDDQPGGNSL